MRKKSSKFALNSVSLTAKSLRRFPSTVILVSIVTEQQDVITEKCPVTVFTLESKKILESHSNCFAYYFKRHQLAYFKNCSSLMLYVFQKEHTFLRCHTSDKITCILSVRNAVFIQTFGCNLDPYGLTHSHAMFQFPWRMKHSAMELPDQPLPPAQCY